MLRAKYPTQSPGWIKWRLNQIKDTMPALPMDVDAHRIGPSSFHEQCKARMSEADMSSITSMRAKLSEVYDNFSANMPPESRGVIMAVNERALVWLDEVGLGE
jgi:hypothetical protein